MEKTDAFFETGASSETVLQFMGKDHDRLDKIFQEFKSKKNTDQNKAKELFHEFKVGLQKHIVWEEEILFPIFENKAGMTSEDAGPTAVMRMEHRKIKDCLEKIHHNLTQSNLIRRNNKDNLPEKELIDVLTEHNNKEESILYPWIDDSVNEAELREIFAKMEKLPPEKYNRCCEH